jgi:hypothetical protein
MQARSAHSETSCLSEFSLDQRTARMAIISDIFFIATKVMDVPTLYVMDFNSQRCMSDEVLSESRIRLVSRLRLSRRQWT